MTTKTEFNKMSMADMKAHVERAERQVNELHQHFMKFVDDNDISAPTMAAALIGMIGRMVTTTVGDDVKRQDEYLEHIRYGILISMAENGHREFPDNVSVPPWLKN